MAEEYRRNGFLSEMTYSSVGREGAVRGGFSEVAISGLQYINLINLVQIYLAMEPFCLETSIRI